MVNNHWGVFFPGGAYSWLRLILLKAAAKKIHAKIFKEKELLVSCIA